MKKVIKQTGIMNTIINFFRNSVYTGINIVEATGNFILTIPVYGRITYCIPGPDFIMSRAERCDSTQMSILDVFCNIKNKEQASFSLY